MRRLSMSAVMVLAAACSSTEPPASSRESATLAQAAGPTLSREALMDPETCAGCHPKHYREWASSMHAYAGEDPVFIAMNKRGQRETNGELGDFCVKCHAPMALAEGLTTDGLNLAELPKKMRGVTCYFCHNAVDVGPEHFNAPIKLANDTTMRSSIKDPANPGVHGVAYTEFHDNRSNKSSVMCGACHDIVNTKGQHIERTFKEYKDSFFSLERTSASQGGESCQGCHMRVTGTDTVATLPGLPKRELHEHRWAAVDVALTDDFPDQDAFRKLTECELSTAGARINNVYTDGRGRFEIDIETDAGHAQPSGAAQDRRLWLQFVAYNAQNQVIFQSGVIPEGEVEEHPVGDPKHDRNLFMLRDHFFDETGKEVHMFWEAARITSQQIPVPVDPRAAHTKKATYQIPTRQQPARVELVMKMRPIGIDVLQNLVESGDLDPAVIKKMPTFTLWSTRVIWTPDKGNNVYQPWPEDMPIECFTD
jgi:hypothetical protein